MAGCQFALLGAGGGILVVVLAVYRWIAVWQAERRTAAGKLKKSPPKLGAYVDWPSHVWSVMVRAALGALAALLFGLKKQIDGAYVIVALGFAARSVLNQLGKDPQIAALVAGRPGAQSAGETNRTGNWCWKQHV